MEARPSPRRLDIMLQALKPSALTGSCGIHPAGQIVLMPFRAATTSLSDVLSYAPQNAVAEGFSPRHRCNDATRQAAKHPGRTQAAPAALRRAGQPPPAGPAYPRSTIR